MKRLWFIAMLAFSASACVEANNPVQLLSAKPRDPADCGQLSDVSLARGRLNFNAGTSYRMAFQLFSPVDEDLAAGPAALYASEVVYNYESENPRVSFTEEILPIYFVVPVGADPEETWFEVDLIASKAREKLKTSVPAAPDTMTLFVTVKLRGEGPGGGSVETNEVTYPIGITRGEGCREENGQQPANVPPDSEAFPCGYPGQDAFFNSFTCVPLP